MEDKPLPGQSAGKKSLVTQQHDLRWMRKTGSGFFRMQLAGQGSEVEEVESKGRNADRTVKENYEAGAE